MSKAELRDTLRAKYATPVAERGFAPEDEPLDFPEEVAVERAFVVHAESGRTVITAPLREVAASNAGFTYLRGRLVEADHPNGNGAYWSTEDLQLGEATVAGGPLNWLHDDTKIIGALMDGHLVSGREAAAGGVGNHIVSTAAVWKFLFPRESDVVEKAALGGELYYSMECISREVACLDSPGRPGCGESFSYGDYDAGNCCSHLRERSSIRQFKDPIFLGAAVIVPPVRPGWANANVDVVRQAAALAEKEHLASDLSEAQARDLAAAVLAWANRS